MLFWETNNLALEMAKCIYFKIPVYPLLLNVLQLLLSFIQREAVLGIRVQRFEYTSYNVNLNAVRGEPLYFSRPQFLRLQEKATLRIICKTEAYKL